jgi:RNA polymerase sigma-70 factor (ECF subfamily)
VPLPSHTPLEQLLEAYRDGSLDAFNEFFQRTKDPLYTYVQRRVKNTEVAQDIIQDAFLRVHRYISSFRRSEGKALPWILSIVQNCINDYYNQQNLRRVENDTSAGSERAYFSSTEDKLLFKEVLFQLEKHIEPAELDMLLQRLVSESSFNEIAQRQGIQVDNARQRFSRILKKLKQLRDDL